MLYLPSRMDSHYNAFKLTSAQVLARLATERACSLI